MAYKHKHAGLSMTLYYPPQNTLTNCPEIVKQSIYNLRLILKKVYAELP